MDRTQKATTKRVKKSTRPAPSAARRRLRILIAPDSLKGSVEAPEAAKAIAKGAGRAIQGGELLQRPIADGGEGTLAVLARAWGLKIQTMEVAGPRRSQVEAKWGFSEKDKLAVIEMAQAAGLALLRPLRRDPLVTTTFGVGELMREAMRKGAQTIYVTLGGSATVDGGAGMAQALGWRLYNKEGGELPRGGGALVDLGKIDNEFVDLHLGVTKVIGLADVTNPLLGAEGAAKVFGPQKGADEEGVKLLGEGLKRLATVTKGTKVAKTKSTGAAGGLGFGLMQFAGAKLKPGFDEIAKAQELNDALQTADLVITAEGSYDEQSLAGKATIGVARLAKKAGVPCIVLAGHAGAVDQSARRSGVTSVLPIVNRPMEEREAMERAAELLEQAAESAVRLFIAGE